MILPMPRSKTKILEIVYNNAGIKVTELLKKASVSPRVGYKFLEELKDAKIFKEKITGEKPILREIYPNFESEAGKLIFALLEEEKRILFFKKHKQFLGPFDQLARELKKIDVDTALVFGSYARNGETKESDLDVLFVTNEKEKIEDICGRCFVTLKVRVSPRVISKKEFVNLKGEDELIKNILKYHVCTLNSFRFIELLE